MKLIKQLIHYSQARSIHAMDITVFLRQLATLLSSGIVLTQACEILERSQTKIDLRLLIYKIKQNILAGKTLFHSLCAHPDYFDHFVCQLVKIGDATGKLEILLSDIADYKENQLALYKSLKQACFYPTVLLVSAICILSIMLLFVIPKFKILFQNTSDLPSITVWMFWLADIMQYVIAILFFITITILLCFRGRLKKRTLMFAQFIFFQLPLIKPLIQKIIWARFAKQLGISLAAGIPLTNALTLVASICNNPAFIKDIQHLQTTISQGQQLHLAMTRRSNFPSLMIQLVKVGEASGRLDEMFCKVATFFEAEIAQSTNYLAQLLEPLIMLILGVLIGGLVVGMYLPIFKLGGGL